MDVCNTENDLGDGVCEVEGCNKRSGSRPMVGFDIFGAESSAFLSKEFIS